VKSVKQKKPERDLCRKVKEALTLALKIPDSACFPVVLGLPRLREEWGRSTKTI